MPDIATEARIKSLRNAFERVTDKREKRVITSLVNEHRAGTLTSEKAYCSVIAISELRLARSEIDGKDI